MDPIEEKIEQQLDMDKIGIEQLTKTAREKFDTNTLIFRHLQSEILEMRRRFKNLPQEKGIDGKPPAIEGCYTFKEWCETVLHKPVATVFFLLRGGPKETKPKEETNEIRSIGFTPAERKKLAAIFQTQLDTQIGSESTKDEKKEFLHELLNEFLDGLVSETEDQ